MPAGQLSYGSAERVLEPPEQTHSSLLYRTEPRRCQKDAKCLYTANLMTTILPDSLAILILAAGLGRRMGDAARPKLLLPWHDGKPILWHTVRNALSLELGEVIVVVRPDLPEMLEALRDLPVRCVPNPRYMEGMGTSLAVGIEALSEDAEAVLLMLGDEPDVSVDIVARLIEVYSRNGTPITIAKYGEQVGPPAIFARSIFPDLIRLDGDVGARQLIARHSEWACVVSFEEAERPHDIDTMKDLEY